METTIPRRRRARIFSLAAIIALVALLLPATASVVLGHAAYLTANLACDGTVTYSIKDWTGDDTNGQAETTLSVSYLVNGVGSPISLGTIKFTASNYLQAFLDGISGAPFNIGSANSVTVSAQDVQWNDGLGPFGAYTVTATKTNCAQLTLVKVVSGGPATPGDWTLSAAGSDQLSGTSPVSGGVTAGTYTLSESTGPAHYVTMGWVCLNDTSTDGNAAAVLNTVTLATGESVTCTITNTYVPPTAPPVPPTSPPVPPTSPPCTAANNCFFNTPPPPEVTPSPSPSASPSPTPSASPSPTSTVEAATSKPHITPPPTSSLGGTTGGVSGGIWLVLLVLAGLIGSILMLTPAPARARRKR